MSARHDSAVSFNLNITIYFHEQTNKKSNSASKTLPPFLLFNSQTNQEENLSFCSDTPVKTLINKLNFVVELL